ncbi:MAG: helix-turn-helix transcriptional regulator [Chloroflexi bacterium]|nr:helix-turn-helix transcriptional regulator [Chloroflexota bacterium]
MGKLGIYTKRQPSAKFGRYLRQLREQRTELSQSETAKQLGITRQELNYYENGTRTPKDPLLLRLAHLYHVATAEIMEKAYWPQLVLLPLIAIINPEQLSKDYIDEIEKGLQEDERRKITKFIEDLIRQRVPV